MPGLGVEGGEKAARPFVAARRPDDHLIARNARSHGERVPILRIGHARFPHRLAGERVQRYQPSVDHRRDDSAVVESHAAVHGTAANLRPHGGLIHFRIPAPQLLARASVQRVDDAPGRDAIERVVPHQRRSLLIPAARAHGVGPNRTQALGVRVVDLLQRAEARLALVASVAQPRTGQRIISRAPGVPQNFSVYVHRLRGLLRRQPRSSGKGQQSDRQGGAPR